MIKIATHNSATGEKGKGILSVIGAPFAKNQSKTIKEQYDAGCRMFDIRVKLIKGEWKCAHGLWQSKRLAYDILDEINSFKEKCYVTLTYEGTAKKKEEFVEYVNMLKKSFTNICWGAISVKYGEGSHLFKVQYGFVSSADKGFPGGRQGFLPLNGSTWHILLPIPWLWKKIYNDNPEFSEDYFTYVDFL